MVPFADVLADRVVVPALSEHDNPLISLYVSKTAVLELCTHISLLENNIKSGNSDFPKTAFKTCLSCWHKRSFPDDNDKEARRVYKYLLLTDVQV
jgi:hypothetical protein